MMVRLLGLEIINFGSEVSKIRNQFLRLESYADLLTTEETRGKQLNKIK